VSRFAGRAAFHWPFASGQATILASVYVENLVSVSEMHIRCAAGWVLSTVAVLVVAATGLPAGESSANESETGELRLEAASVEKLVLTSEDDRRHTVDRSAETVALPPGRYRPLEVTLWGDYRCWPHQAREADWVSVAAGQTTVLKVGAPLQHRIRLERQGALLVFNYELIGQGGERYGPPRAAGKPRFAVYRNDQELFSASFEYG
jgi:hypothetical protein